MDKAVVTGATSGLGKAVSLLLKEKGFEVLEVGRTSPTFPIDLSKAPERQKLLSLITEHKPSLIINNAGFGLYGPTLDLSMEEQLAMIEVNITALFEITLHGAKTMLQTGRGGTILNISSAAAFFPYPTFNVYSASKAFVRSFSLALHHELKGQGVHVLCACPGQIATDFRHRAGKGHPQKKDRRTMDVQQAAERLWRQIEAKTPEIVFDGKTRALLAIARCLPRFLLYPILVQGLKDRY